MNIYQELQQFIKSKPFKRHWKSMQSHERPFDKYQALHSFHETPKNLIAYISTEFFAIDNYVSKFSRVEMIDKIEYGYYDALCTAGYPEEVVDEADVVVAVKMITGAKSEMEGPEPTYFELEVTASDWDGNPLDHQTYRVDVIPNELGASFKYALQDAKSEEMCHVIFDGDDSEFYRIALLQLPYRTETVQFEGEFYAFVSNAMLEYVTGRYTTDSSLELKGILSAVYSSDNTELGTASLDGNMGVHDVCILDVWNIVTNVPDRIFYPLIENDEGGLSVLEGKEHLESGAELTKQWVHLTEITDPDGQVHCVTLDVVSTDGALMEVTTKPNTSSEQLSI